MVLFEINLGGKNDTSNSVNYFGQNVKDNSRSKPD